MLQKKNGLIVMNPAYEPRKEFIEYARTVSESACRVVVINDGSGREYDEIFDEIAKIDNVTYLKHEVNRGKGSALKTGLQYCVSELEPESVLVTADCDGQHAPEDVVKVYEAALSHKDCLILGSRNFELGNIPPKSQMGNTMFRKAYRFFYGLNIYDTQTGLRGFTVSLAEELLLVRGDRFEYEMSVLIYAKKNRIEILEVPIQTIYPEDPKDHVTHYRPIKDSLEIFGVVLKNLRTPKKRVRRSDRKKAKGDR